MIKLVNNTDVLIIGAGPAGITAAIYALRAGCKVIVCEKGIYGGQTSIIETIENYPGFKSISGFEFANTLHEQASDLGAEFVYGEVTAVDLNGDSKKVIVDNKNEILAKAVIIANGLKRRILGCEGEKEFMGKGVSYCATCDGAFFKSKNVVVVGGGNTALEDALYLSNICSNVTLIVRKDHFRAEKILADMVAKKNNIEVMFNSNIKKICGTKSVESVEIITGGNTSLKNVDGVFIAIGYNPDNKIFDGTLKTDELGYFVADETCKTNVKGVYVAGDCRAKPLRQIATAVADGAVAGNSAAMFAKQ